jgi:Pyruvate/2-oxoglutarate dehydrogenase complex, dihydrolipoamide dehydrogenase (E3) component, and related enzymes
LTISSCLPQDAVAYGWEIPNVKSVQHNWANLREAVQNHVKSVNWVTRVMLRDKKVDYLNALGKFIDQHSVEATMKNGKYVNKVLYVNMNFILQTV